MKLHFPREYVDKESFEDFLIQVNKQSGGQGNFRNLDDWMRSLLRNYALNSVSSLNRWETTKLIPTATGGAIRVPELTFWKGDAEGLEDGAEGEPVNLMVGKLQYEYLKRAVAWENTYQKEIQKSEIEHRNVAALARFVILHAMLAVQVKVEEEKLIEEEKALQKETGEEDPTHL